MHDDINDGDDQAQGASPPPRIIICNDRPFVIDDTEGDGITRIIQLRIVPEAFFRLGINLALPDWTLDSADILDSPPLQFLALLNEAVELRRDAVAALRDIRANLRATRSVVEDGGRATAIERIDDMIKSIGAISLTLDI